MCEMFLLLIVLSNNVENLHYGGNSKNYTSPNRLIVHTMRYSAESQ